LRAARRLVRGRCETADIWVIAVNYFMFAVLTPSDHFTDAAASQQEM
jgi:hypothetical protein